MASANCGSAWDQSFALDAFGNLQKTGLGGGAESFVASFSNNRVSSTGGMTPTYDGDGNTTYDTVHHYTWDTDGNMIGVDGSTTVTYDAFDRVAEIANGGHTQVVYGPGGGKLALMSGQTLNKALVPLAGGTEAVYTSSGLAYYRHSDWLDSSRLASTTSRTVYYDGAYAPYGENYAETGTNDRKFAGMEQDIISSGPYPLYDALMREYHPTWGRWLSPDPAGMAAASPANPQSWNMYAYVENNPTSFIDPLGLFRSALDNSWYESDCYENILDCLPGGTGASLASLLGLPSGPAPRLPHISVLPLPTLSHEVIASLLPKTCPPVPPAPLGQNVNTNIVKTIATKASDQAALGDMIGGRAAFAWWVNEVRPYGNWDYKRQGVQYAPFGNFNYGATGAALGISLPILQRAGGAVAQYFGTHEPAWGNWYKPPYYGHDPADVQSIAEGYMYEKLGCN